MASTYTEATLLVDAAEEALVVGGDDPSENSPATVATHALDPKDPCTFCAHEDFVIFSEFSEVLGPLPLLTVPPHVHDEPAAELDMNAFILKIMSVDYQANPSGQFNLAEDAQVLQTPVVPGVHAYVHYFTLYDLHARGFVRPMCLAFVTRDKKKLEGQFLQLREAFLKVTELIKLDNRQIFLEDIKHALHCLRSTQEQYFRLKKMEDEREILSTESKQLLQSIDIEQLVNHYSELKNLLHTVEPSLNKEQQMMELKDWCAAIKNSDLPEAKRLLQKLECHSAKLPCNLSGSKRARFIRPVVCISPWGCAAGLWHLIDLHHFFARCSLGVDLDLVATTFNQAIRPRQLTFRGINLALDDANFLKLLSNITDPKECTIDQNSLILDNHKELSSSDSNCSFHSAKPSLLSSSGSDSFRDLDRNLSDWSLNDNTAEKFQTDCLWSEFPANTKSGLGLLDFFTKYSAAARHVIYSLLTGRTVVLAAAKHEKAYAVEITQALAPFVPRRNTKSVLRWHQGILVSFHLDQHKLIGLCVPERLTVHDMINSLDKNRVTILELGSKQLLGPAYSGSLLSGLQPSLVALHKSDQSLCLVLHALLSAIDQKVSVCRTVGVTCLIELGLHGCDAAIVKYLAQLALSNDPTLL